MRTRVGVLAAVLVVALAGSGVDVARAAEEGPWSAEETIYVIVLSPGPQWKMGRPLSEQGLGPHAAYMKRLLDEGRLYAGGPLSDTEGGLVLVRAPDLAAAQAIVAEDPAVTGGLFTGEVHVWHPKFRSPEALAAP